MAYIINHKFNNKNQLEKQGFSKEKIDSELAELIKAASEGVSNGYDQK